MKRLIIDMDDVMADATGQFIEMYEKEFGLRVLRESLNGKSEGNGFPENHEIVMQYPYRPNFFRMLLVNENCQEVMYELNKKYEVFIVSAAIPFPLSLNEKLDWLAEHFPFLTSKQIVFCGSKSIVHGDYMIDDMHYNLESFGGDKFLYTAPHNTHYDHFERLNNWKEIGDKFL